MSRYRKVDPRIWNDEKFRELTDNAKFVFFLLLTHPNMTALGAMRSTVSGLAEELGWEPEAFREAFQQLIDKGMAEHDKKACLIALCNFIKYNPPESPNVVKAWAGALDLLPECELKTRVIARAVGFAKAMKEAFAEALPEAFLKGMANQKQKQEQEQEQEQNSKACGLPKNFAVSERVKAWALENKYSEKRVTENFDKFVLYVKREGKKYKDWDAALMTAIRDDWAKVGAQKHDRHNNFDQQDYHAGVNPDGSF